MKTQLAARVAELQEEYFAEDLLPPAAANGWADAVLRSFYENGGTVETALAKVAGELVPALVDAGLFTIDELIAADLTNLEGLSSVGARTRLRLLQSHELAYRRESEGARQQLLAEREANAAFRIDVDVYNASPNGGDEGSAGTMTVQQPLLPNGQAITVGSAGSEIGGSVWPCATLLAHYLSAEGLALVQGACIAELGAGTGLAGLHAAALGARQLVLSDALTRSHGKAGELEALLSSNIERNRHLLTSCAGALAVADCDFANPPHAEAVARLALRRASEGAGPSVDGFDLVIVSDCTYEGIGVKFSELARTIQRTLRRHSSARALVCHEVRLKPDAGLASDTDDVSMLGGDPALMRLRASCTAHRLAWRFAHDDRPLRAFAQSGMRCIIELRHDDL